MDWAGIQNRRDDGSDTDGFQSGDSGEIETYNTAYCHANRYACTNTYAYSGTHCYPNANLHAASDPDSKTNVHAVPNFCTVTYRYADANLHAVSDCYADTEAYAYAGC